MLNKSNLMNIMFIAIISLIFKEKSIFLISLPLFAILIKLQSGIKGKDKSLINIALMINLVVMLIIYIGYIVKYRTPYYIGGSDDLAFENFAFQLIEDENVILPNDIAIMPEYMYNNGIGYIWFIRLLINISSCFGEFSTITPRIINIFLLIYLTTLVYKYYVSKYGYKYSELLIILMGVFPNTVYISVHVFRDVFSSFLLFAIFYISYNLRKYQGKIINIIYLGVLIYFSYWMRETTIIYVVLIILLVCRKKELSTTKLLIICAILGGIYIFTGGGAVLHRYLNSYNIYMTTVSDGISNIIFSTNILPFGIFMRVMYGLVYPFPAYLINIGSFFTDIDIATGVLISTGTIVQIYLLPYLFKGIKRLNYESIIFLFIFFSIILTTFGFRHFIILYPFMFILICKELRWVKRSELIKNNLFISYMLGILCLIYMLVKF